MPQNPVKTTLFVSQIESSDLTVSPSEGTGIVTLTIPASSLLAWFQTNSGTFTANGATAVTVVAPEVTGNSQILITLKTATGTVGAIPHVETITPGTGFTVVGTASDDSVYNFTVIG